MKGTVILERHKGGYLLKLVEQQRVETLITGDIKEAMREISNFFEKFE